MHLVGFIIRIYHDVRSSEYQKPHSSKRYGYPCTGLYRRLVLQESEVPSISRQSAHDGGMVVSHIHRLPLPTQKIPGTQFC
jgi:hypothetical protein